MARYLLDTNVLLRIANVADAQHQLATAATLQLISNGENLFLTPHTLIEFWSVATRPLTGNGLDWEPSRVELQLQTVLGRFPLWTTSLRFSMHGAGWLGFTRCEESVSMTRGSSPSWKRIKLAIYSRLMS